MLSLYIDPGLFEMHQQLVAHFRSCWNVSEGNFREVAAVIVVSSSTQLVFQVGYPCSAMTKGNDNNFSTVCHHCIVGCPTVWLHYTMLYLIGWGPWASGGFFPGGHQGIFPKFFQGDVKSGEICFFPLEIKKTIFFAEISKIHGALPPLPPPFHVGVSTPTPMLGTLGESQGGEWQQERCNTCQHIFLQLKILWRMVSNVSGMTTASCDGSSSSWAKWEPAS